MKRKYYYAYDIYRKINIGNADGFHIIVCYYHHQRSAHFAHFQAGIRFVGPSQRVHVVYVNTSHPH